MATPSSQVDQADPGPRVAAYMRVVANGVTKNGRAKATLIVTPQSPTNGAATGLNLATWPGDIVNRLAGLAPPDKFPAKYSLTDPSNGAPSSVRLKNPSFSALADESSGLKEVNTLWRKAIEETGDATPWQTLLADIDRSARGQKNSADLKSSYSGDTSKATLLDNGALVANPHDPKKQTVVKGVLPNPQTSYAVDTEAARAQRVAKKLAIGPYLPGDQDVNLQTAVPDPTTFAAQRKAALLQRLKDAVASTDPYRQRSQKDFNDVKAAPALAGSAAAPAAAPASPPAPAAAQLPIAPPALVLGKQANGNAAGSVSRAAHVYGSWTQWSPQHQDAFAAAAAASAPGAPRPTPKAAPDPAAKLYSIYYSLQGDPILSRLFGFAFDIEFDIPNDIVLSSPHSLCAVRCRNRSMSTASMPSTKASAIKQSDGPCSTAVVRDKPRATLPLPIISVRRPRWFCTRKS